MPMSQVSVHKILNIRWKLFAASKTSSLSLNKQNCCNNVICKHNLVKYLSVTCESKLSNECLLSAYLFKLNIKANNQLSHDIQDKRGDVDKMSDTDSTDAGNLEGNLMGEVSGPRQHNIIPSSTWQSTPVHPSFYAL